MFVTTYLLRYVIQPDNGPKQCPIAGQIQPHGRTTTSSTTTSTSLVHVPPDWDNKYGRHPILRTEEVSLDSLFTCRVPSLELVGRLVNIQSIQSLIESTTNMAPIQ